MDHAHKWPRLNSRGFPRLPASEHPPPLAELAYSSFIPLNMPTPLKILVPIKRVIDYAVSLSPPSSPLIAFPIPSAIILIPHS